METVFWKIEFDEGLEGFGYLELDSQMVQVNLFDEKGDVVEIPVGYHPIEFKNVIPPWL